MMDDGQFNTNYHTKELMSMFLAVDGDKHRILFALVTRLLELPLRLERMSRMSRLAIESVLELSPVLA